MRIITLAAYTKGGLGDVRALPPDEFDMYYMAMLLHSDEVNKQVKEAVKKAKEGSD